MGDEIEDGLEYQADQFFVVREEQDIAQHGAGGCGGIDRLDTIFGALHQQLEGGQGSAQVGADARQLAGERGAEGDVTAP